jgi:transposase
MWAMWLQTCGLSDSQICCILEVCDNTLRKYVRQYSEGGLDALKRVPFMGRHSDLDKYKATVEGDFRKRPPASVAEAQARIKRLTGVERSPSQIRAFVHRLGMKFRKVAAVPSKADPAEQEKFRKQKLDPRLEQAEAGTRKVYFVDAAHFVQGAFLGFLWCFARVFVRSSSGRRRFNVLGALCPITHRLIMVSNTTYINASTVCELLHKLAAESLSIPITVVLDNASYQHCKLVESVAQSLGIELLFLPTYSPNLNLIERLWKFTKKNVLYSKYYSTFTEFKEAISSLLANAHITHRKELDSLLTLKFQRFKNAA